MLALESRAAAVGFGSAWFARQPVPEARRLVELAEEGARKQREPELKLLVTLFEGVLKSQMSLARLIARKPTL